MALTFAQLFTPVQLPAAAAVLFTLNVANGVLKNGRVRLTNTSAGAVTVTLYMAAAASPSAAATSCLNAKSIAMNDYLDIDIPTMANGDTLRGFASAATSITMHEIGGVIYS